MKHLSDDINHGEIMDANIELFDFYVHAIAKLCSTEKGSVGDNQPIMVEGPMLVAASQLVSAHWSGHDSIKLSNTLNSSRSWMDLN